MKEDLEKKYDCLDEGIAAVVMSVAQGRMEGKENLKKFCELATLCISIQHPSKQYFLTAMGALGQCNALLDEDIDALIDLHTRIAPDNRESYAFLESPNKFLSPEKTDKTKRMEADAWIMPLKIPLTKALGSFASQMNPTQQTKFLKACQVGIDGNFKIKAAAEFAIKNCNMQNEMDAGAKVNGALAVREITRTWECKYVVTPDTPQTVTITTGLSSTESENTTEREE